MKKKSRNPMKILQRLLLVLMTLFIFTFTGCQSTASTGSGSTSDDTQELKVVDSEEDASEELSDSTDMEDSSNQNTVESDSDITVTEDGTYTSKEEVALYIHQYGHLPSNYVSKTKARKAGWDSKEGNLDEVLPGKSIGGSEFKNYDGTLPDASGRSYTECDINYTGGYRGSERIIFSNDGLVFYTNDHYKTFEQLY